MTTAAPSRHLNVLYVEDDPVLRDLFAAKLGHLRIVRSVYPCGTARDALNAAAAGTFGVALLDLNLGDGQINGIDLGLALRAVSARIPIVIFSQYAVPRVENVVPSRERYAWSFVQKSGKLEVARVGEVIERTIAGNVEFGIEAPVEDHDASPLGRLSRRQRQVMALASAGYDAKAIAERLHLAHVSVRRELSLAYRVLVPSPEPGTDLRTVAVLEYVRLSGTSAQTRSLP